MRIRSLLSTDQEKKDSKISIISLRLIQFAGKETR